MPPTLITPPGSAAPTDEAGPPGLRPVARPPHTPDPRPLVPAPATGSRRRLAAFDAPSGRRGLRAARAPAWGARRDRRLHRGGDRAARGRAPRVLRPPPRARPDRLGEGRAAPRGVGGAAGGDAPAGRLRGPAALRAARLDRRPRLQQPGHGRGSPAPCAPGARPPPPPPTRSVGGWQ